MVQKRLNHDVGPAYGLVAWLNPAWARLPRCFNGHATLPRISSQRAGKLQLFTSEHVTIRPTARGFKPTRWSLKTGLSEAVKPAQVRPRFGHGPIGSVSTLVVYR